MRIFRYCLDGANSVNITIEFYSNAIPSAVAVYFHEILKINLSAVYLQILVFQRGEKKPCKA
jgi:hypothetical protein